MNLQHHESPCREVLAVLKYFHYFSYPLLPEEIRQYCSVRISCTELEIVLAEKAAAGMLETKHGFWGFAPVAGAVANREEGARRFEQLAGRIDRSVASIRQFPFVQLVGLSGSLSKGYAGTRADIDFFIVTQTDRLWICRTLLHLFKKITFIRSMQHWYCMNYFIDESALALEEQNYYTAIELVTLKPLYNVSGCYERLLAANRSWIQDQLPNWTPAGIQPQHRPAGSFWSRIIRGCCSSRLNHWLMLVTDKKWRRKWKSRHYPEEDYELAFKTRVNISKNHYHNYQKKLLKYMKD